MEAIVTLHQLVELEKKFSEGKKTKQAMTEGLSDFQVAYLIYKGAYTILAHKKAQSKRNHLMKVGLEMERKAQSDPKFAEFMGYGKRVELSEEEEN